MPVNINQKGSKIYGEKQFSREVEYRKFRLFNQLSIYAFVVVVYGGALISDYFLFALVSWLLKDDIAHYPVVALWFDYARIGLALLLIFTALIHGVLSTIGQVKLDYALSREGD